MSQTAHQFDPSILREYDIRGIVGGSVHVADARAIEAQTSTIQVVDIQLGIPGLAPPTQERVFYRDLRTKLLFISSFTVAGAVALVTGAVSISTRRAFERIDTIVIDPFEFG